MKLHSIINLNILVIFLFYIAFPVNLLAKEKVREFSPEERKKIKSFNNRYYKNQAMGAFGWSFIWTGYALDLEDEDKKTISAGLAGLGTIYGIIQIFKSNSTEIKRYKINPDLIDLAALLSFDVALGLGYVDEMVGPIEHTDTGNTLIYAGQLMILLHCIGIIKGAFSSSPVKSNINNKNRYTLAMEMNIKNDFIGPEISLRF